MNIITNKIPTITVKSEIKKVSETNPLIKDVVCLIGCFEDTETLNEPTFCETLTAAETIFGSDDQYDGNAALKQIFANDISGCLIVNCTSVTGTGNDATVSRTLTQAKIEAALALIELIDFDILYCAVELADGMIDKIAPFCADRFEGKRPCGYVGAGSRASAAAYTTTAGKLGDWCYGFITQSVTVGTDELSLLETGAYLTNIIATLPVGNSLTAKILEDVTAIGTSYTYGASDLGTTLVEQGFIVLRLTDALNNTFEVINSANHNGLDLYISRVRDYIVNDFALRDFLGERSNNVTLDLISLECARIYNKFTDELGLIEDMTYVIEKENPSTVNVIINELAFAGVITDLNVYFTIEVV